MSQVIDFQYSTLPRFSVDLGMIKAELVIEKYVQYVVPEAARSNIHVHLVAQLLAIYTLRKMK